ncbi:helix-turn-helix domain-containing protein [Flavobacterium sp.]|uniref:helix-turn-helix domain-containing protein n=1 Tax=Flavobacterium sp. TaxID=239 RepID=UPI003526EA58
MAGVFSEDAYFKYFYIPFSSLFMALFYLYVKYFLNLTQKFNKKDLIFFIPFIIALTESVLEKIGFAINIFHLEDIRYFNYFRIAQEYFNILYSFFLIIFSLKLINKYNVEVAFKLPNRSIQWLKILSYVFLFLNVYWILPLTLEVTSDPTNALKYYYPLWVSLSVTIYILGHVGIYHFGVFLEQKNIRKFSINSVALIKKESKPSAAKNENLVLFEKFVNDEKNFLNSNLSLEMVAEELNINKTYLSRLLNTEYGKNFSNYINELRVAEAKKYLQQEEFQNYTLISIGLEAGFNSKTAFNAAFKKFTGNTPSEYRKSIKTTPELI